MTDEPRMKLDLVDASTGKPCGVFVYEEHSCQFAARLKKMFKARRKWARRVGVTCYRVYDADLPDYAAAIDVYHGFGPDEGSVFAVVAEYAPPKQIDAGLAARRMHDMVVVSAAVLGVPAECVFEKRRERAKGGSQYAAAGSKTNRRAIISEAGHPLEADFGSYLDTGLFLDHRITREYVDNLAHGKSFLNLFAYTGSATVHAACGGATSTLTVDMSQTYIDWAQRNMALNGFEDAAHTFLRADVLSWIEQAVKKPERFDVIFVDPPTFSNSKAMGKRTWDVQRDHVTLLTHVAALLSSGGIAVFSCNLRSFKMDYAALQKQGIRIEDITEQTIPEDFSRNPKIHCCFTVRVNAAG